jgi:hypothetical protein
MKLLTTVIYEITCSVIWKILPLTVFKDPKAAILTLKRLPESHLCIVKAYLKPPVTSLFSHIFPVANESSILESREHRPITVERILRRVFSNNFKIT